MLVAPSITWLLVRISPSDVTTMPVPAACSCWYPSDVLMSTKPGSTFSAIAFTSLGPEPDEDEPELPLPPLLPELPGTIWNGLEPLPRGGKLLFDAAEGIWVPLFQAAWPMPM